MNRRSICITLAILGLAAASAMADSLDDQIKQKQKEVDALQKQVDPKVAPLLVDSDIRVWVASSILTTVTAAYNDQPNHHFHFGSTGEGGQIKNSNGGGVGCGWYVALEPNSECRPGQSPHSACGDLDAPKLSPTYHPDGSFTIAADYNFSFAAQVHGHVKGPAGPCSLLHPLPTCDCPIGGGAGTSVHAEAANVGTVTGDVQITADATSWLVYNVKLASPPSIHTDLKIDLQKPGGGSFTVQVPVDTPLPPEVLAAGNGGQAFNRDGELVVGNPPIVDRKYHITLTPANVKADATGYSVKASAEVTWLNPSP